ncbi:MAG: type-4 uracil-DNA glycosylase [Candidatus Methanomethyliaceae archaeon]|nr:type-4 uracil-DNA glycosylase [Candidatus Methanomethyliaceae archaeon]MDW7970518.1 type-4 uracil-DNA glycosylase [Nitrososphaerota archaeon]
MKIEALQAIAKEIAECRKCRLWTMRLNPVPGDGNPNAKIMFIGEAPGYYEDIEGKPFVGAAGRLLNQLLMGLNREELFITNIVKCRPPNNRAPLFDEIAACAEYLDRQILIIKPKVIVCLGRYSTNYILKKSGIKIPNSIAKIRGRLFSIDYQGLRIFAIFTYHPAAALYNPSIRKYLVEDFKLIGEIIKNNL